MLPSGLNIRRVRFLWNVQHSCLVGSRKYGCGAEERPGAKDLGVVSTLSHEFVDAEERRDGTLGNDEI